jgi:hypothetical protein
MTKADLVGKILANTGLTKDEAFAYLETVLETIKKTLEAAETVKIGPATARRDGVRLPRLAHVYPCLECRFYALGRKFHKKPSGFAG